MPRREFIAISGLTRAALFDPAPATAGPFAASYFEKMIPADKKLRP